MTGSDLAAIIDTLATEWERWGPEPVHHAIQFLDRETLEHLVMMQVGVRAM
jgi:hypothetical protein